MALAKLCQGLWKPLISCIVNNMDALPWSKAKRLCREKSIETTEMLSQDEVQWPNRPCFQFLAFTYLFSLRLLAPLTPSTYRTSLTLSACAPGSMGRLTGLLTGCHSHIQTATSQNAKLEHFRPLGRLTWDPFSRNPSHCFLSVAYCSGSKRHYHDRNLKIFRTLHQDSLRTLRICLLRCRMRDLQQHFYIWRS